jgi:hypothetical protein
VRDLCESAGLEIVELRTFHELSFPYDFYLSKLVGSASLVRALLPAVTAVLWLFKSRLAERDKRLTR